MKLKTKCWIAWAVLGATAIMGLVTGASPAYVWTFTITAAVAGWIAFFLPE